MLTIGKSKIPDLRCAMTLFTFHASRFRFYISAFMDIQKWKIQ